MECTEYQLDFFDRSFSGESFLKAYTTANI